MLPVPDGDRDARQRAEDEPLQAVAEPLLAEVELQERPDRPDRQVGRAGSGRPSRSNLIASSVVYSLILRRNVCMSGIVRCCRACSSRPAVPSQVDRLVDRADPAAGAAAEEAERPVVLRAREAGTAGRGSRSGSARGSRRAARPGRRSTRRISAASSGVARSSASMAKTQSPEASVERGVALAGEVVERRGRRRRSAPRWAIASVWSRLARSTTTITSSAQATDARQPGRFVGLVPGEDQDRDPWAQRMRAPPFATAPASARAGK